MKTFDVVIIGAGCAGLMSAQLLAKKNLSVVLIDGKKDLLDLSFLTLGSFMNIDDYGLSERVIASKIDKGSLLFQTSLRYETRRRRHHRQETAAQ